MESLGNREHDKNSLGEQIDQIVVKADEIISVLSSMLAESETRTDLDGNWIKSALANVASFRSNLVKAVIACDLGLISYWSREFISMQKYFLDKTLASSYEPQLREKLDEINNLAPGPGFHIDQYDKASLRDFRAES